RLAAAQATLLEPCRSAPLDARLEAQHPSFERHRGVDQRVGSFTSSPKELPDQLPRTVDPEIERLAHVVVDGLIARLALGPARPATSLLDTLDPPLQPRPPPPRASPTPGPPSSSRPRPCPARPRAAPAQPTTPEQLTAPRFTLTRE